MLQKKKKKKEEEEKKGFTSDSTGVQLAKQDKWFTGIRLKSSPDAAWGSVLSSGLGSVPTWSPFPACRRPLFLLPSFISRAVPSDNGYKKTAPKIVFDKNVFYKRVDKWNCNSSGRLW